MAEPPGSLQPGLQEASGSTHPTWQDPSPRPRQELSPRPRPYFQAQLLGTTQSERGATSLPTEPERACDSCDKLDMLVMLCDIKTGS